MSYVLSFTIDRQVAKSEARNIASRLSDETGLRVWPAIGWFASSADCFVATDAGELSADVEGRFVPRERVANTLLATIRGLLELSSWVVFCGAWVGEEDRRDVELALEEFARILRQGDVEDGVAYRIHLEPT